jgi:hypothetical protein
MSKYTNHGFPFCRVITKIRGIDGKSPKINAKHDYNK